MSRLTRVRRQLFAVTLLVASAGHIAAPSGANALAVGSVDTTSVLTMSGGAVLDGLGIGAATPCTSWTGTWDTTYGLMRLTTSGSSVTGGYASNNGKITGTVFGGTLTGSWSEAPSYRAPDHAGDVQLTLAADGSFSGRWRYGSSGDWQGWRGSCVSGGGTSLALPAAGPCGNWTGTWSTTYGAMSLSSSGTSVAGNYESNSGRIIGSIFGSSLSGTWSESPTYQAPDHAGDVQFALGADGSINGRWRYGSSGDWQAWSGTCSSGGSNASSDCLGLVVIQLCLSP